MYLIQSSECSWVVHKSLSCVCESYGFLSLQDTVCQTSVMFDKTVFFGDHNESEFS